MKYKFIVKESGPGFIAKIKLIGTEIDYSKVPRTFRAELEPDWHGTIDFIPEDRLKGYVRVTFAFIAKDLRNKGIGEDLYRLTLKWLKKNGYKGICSKYGQRITDESESLWKKLKTSEINGYDIMESKMANFIEILEQLTEGFKSEDFVIRSYKNRGEDEFLTSDGKWVGFYEIYKGKNPKFFKTEEDAEAFAEKKNIKIKYDCIEWDHFEKSYDEFVDDEENRDE